MVRHSAIRYFNVKRGIAYFVLISHRMMEQSLVGELIKTQDLPYVVTSVSKNPKAFKHAWDFLRGNWESLIKK